MDPRGLTSSRLERLALPLVATVVAAKPGDLVRLVCEADGTWLYCRIEERLSSGDLICSVVDAQSWPSLILDGILPGIKYTIPPDRVLSVVRPA